MNKKISFPIALIIILACAVLVGVLAVWQYLYMSKTEILEFKAAEKTQRNELYKFESVSSLDIFKGIRTDIKIVDNYIYLASGYGIDIIDVSDPTRPREIRTFANSENYNIGSIRIHENYLYIGSDYGLLIYDISNLASPKYLKEYTISFEGIEELFGLQKEVRGNLSFRNIELFDDYIITGGDYGLKIIDISRPQEPKLIAEYIGSDEFLNSGSKYVSEINVISFSRQNSDLFVLAINLENGIDEIMHFDISNKEFNLKNILKLAEGKFYDRIFVSGDYAYLTTYDTDSPRLDIYNIKQQPNFVSSYIGLCGIKDIQFKDKYLLLASNPADYIEDRNFKEKGTYLPDIQIVDMENIEKPLLIYEYTLRFDLFNGKPYAKGVNVLLLNNNYLNNYLYVGTFSKFYILKLK